MNNHNENESAREGISYYALVVYLVFIFLDPQTTFPFLQPLRPALILAIVTLILAFASVKVKVLKPPQTKLIVLFLFLALLSTLLALDKSRGFDLFSAYLKSFFLYLLFYMIIDTPAKMNKIVKLMVVLLFINAAVSFIQHKMGMMGYRLRSFAGGGSNDFALILLAITPLAMNLIQSSASGKGKGVYSFITLTLLLVLTRTRSRMGLLGLAVLVAQVAWQKRKKPLILFLVAGLVVFTLANTHYRTFARLQETDQAEAQSSRLKLWTQALTLIKLRPALGVGPGNFVYAKEVYHIPGDSIHVAHSSFLEVGAEVGVPALIIYLLIMVVSLKDIMIAEKRFKKSDNEMFLISQAVRAGLVTLAFCMLFLSQEYNHFFYIYAAFSATLKRWSLQRSD